MARGRRKWQPDNNSPDRSGVAGCFVSFSAGESPYRMRGGAVIEREYRRAGGARFITQAVCAALLAVFGIVSFVIDDARHGILLLLMAGVFAVPAALRQRYSAALGSRLAPMRAAADSSPEITAADIAPPPPPKRNTWHRAVFVVMTGAVVLGFTTLLDQPRRECRTVDAAVNYLGDHPEMLAFETIPAGGPDLSTYQTWADHALALRLPSLCC